MFCEKCGNPVNDNDKFCQRCGAPIRALPPQPENEPEPVYAYTIQPEQTDEAPQPEVQPEQTDEAPQSDVQSEQENEAPQPEVQSEQENEVPQPEVQPEQENEVPQPEVQPEQENEVPQPEVQPEPVYAYTTQPEQTGDAPQPGGQPAKTRVYGGNQQPRQDAQPVQPYQPYQPYQPGQSFDPAVNTAPDQAAANGGIPKGLKLGLIFGGGGFALLTVILMVIFAIIIPMSKPKIELSRFVTTDFYQYSDCIVDGRISGEFKLDATRIIDAYPDLFGENPADMFSKASYLESALYSVEVEYVDASDADNTSYGGRYTTFGKFKKDGEAKITVKLPEKGGYGYETFAMCESSLGVAFVGGECTVSISDEIEKSSVQVVEMTDVDLLGYLESNKLVTAIIDYNDSVSVGIKTFETKFGDYTFKNESYDSTAVTVYDADGGYLNSVNIKFGNDKNLKAGSKVTVGYEDDDTYLADYYGLNLTGKEFTYSVVMPVKLDEASAKKNVSAIMDYILKHPELDSYYNEKDKLEVGDIYFVTWKENSSYQDIVAVIHNATQKYYCTLELEGKGFFADGEFVYGGYSGYTGNHEKSAADAVKGSAYLQSDSKYYSATKLN